MEKIISKMKEISELTTAKEQKRELRDRITQIERDLKQMNESKHLATISSPLNRQNLVKIEAKKQEKQQLEEQIVKITEGKEKEDRELFKVKKQELIELIKDKIGNQQETDIDNEKPSKDKLEYLKITSNSLYESKNINDLKYLLFRMLPLNYEHLENISEDMFMKEYGNEEKTELKNKETQINYGKKEDSDWER